MCQEKGLQQADGALQELAQSLAFEHTVAKQCNVNKLLYAVLAAGIFRKQVGLLLAQIGRFSFVVGKLLLLSLVELLCIFFGIINRFYCRIGFVQGVFQFLNLAADCRLSGFEYAFPGCLGLLYSVPVNRL